MGMCPPAAAVVPPTAPVGAQCLPRPACPAPQPAAYFGSLAATLTSPLSCTPTSSHSLLRGAGGGVRARCGCGCCCVAVVPHAFNNGRNSGAARRAAACARWPPSQRGVHPAPAPQLVTLLYYVASYFPGGASGAQSVIGLRGAARCPWAARRSSCRSAGQRIAAAACLLAGCGCWPDSCVECTAVICIGHEVQQGKQRKAGQQQVLQQRARGHVPHATASDRRWPPKRGMTACARLGLLNTVTRMPLGR